MEKWKRWLKKKELPFQKELLWVINRLCEMELADMTYVIVTIPMIDSIPWWAVVSRDQLFNQTGANVVACVCVKHTWGAAASPSGSSSCLKYSSAHLGVRVQGPSSLIVPSWLLANSSVHLHPPPPHRSTCIPVFTVPDNNRKEGGNWEPSSCTYSQHSAQWSRKSLATAGGVGRRGRTVWSKDKTLFPSYKQFLAIFHYPVYRHCFSERTRNRSWSFC